MGIRNNARVVVLVEMEDGEIRAIDGTGNVDIQTISEKHDLDFKMFYNPKFLQEQRTRVTVDIIGTWHMYAGRFPKKPEEVEAVKQIEKKPEPGDYDFEW